MGAGELMDNPVFFTVLASDEDGLSLTDAGILGSRIAAETEAARRHERLPGLLHVPAVITIIDQDPATGTPLPHIPPPRPAGYALASLSVAEPSRRHLAPGGIFVHLRTAQHAAGIQRSRNLERGSNCVRDVVALTVLEKRSND